MGQRMVARQNSRGTSLGPCRLCREQAAAPAPPAKKPAPPAPPAKRPAAARKPADLQQRDSGMSLNGANNSDSSRSTTPQPSLGGSLADALLARKNAMQRQQNNADDDW